MLLAGLLLYRQWPNGRIVGADDGGALIYPHLVFLGDSLRQGILPLWNPYEWCGQTFVGYQASPIFYPPNFLCALIPADRYLLLSQVGHIFLGGWGMWLLLQRWGLARSAPWLACAYMTSAPIYAELERLPIVQIAGLAPWFLYCADRLKEDWRWVLPTSALLTLQIYAGFPQAVQLEAATVGCLLLWPWRQRRIFLGLVASAALAGGLSAVLLLPLLAHMQESTRALAQSGYFHVYSANLSQIPAVLLPTFFRLSSNTLAYTPYGIPLGLTLLALASGRPDHPLKRCGWTLAFLGLLLTFSDGTAWEPLLDKLIPTYASCRYRVRFLQLLVLGVTLLSAWTLHHDRRRRVTGLALLALAESLYLAVPYNPAVDPNRAVSKEIFAALNPQARYIPLPFLYRHYWNWGCVSGISAVGGYGSLSNRLYEDVVQFAESGHSARPDNIQECLNNNGIRPHLDPTRPILRIFCPEAALSSASSGSPPQLTRLPAPTPRLALCWRETVLPEVEGRLGRMAAPDFDPGLEVVTETPVGIELTEPDQVQLRLTKFTPNELEATVSWKGPGAVVLRISEVWEEGWHTQVDGQEVKTLRVDHCLRGVLLGPGFDGSNRHVVRQYYWPRPLRNGLWISGATALIWLVGLLAGMLRARPKVNKLPL